MPKFFTRSCIVIFWILLIFGILYFPRWSFVSKDEKSINIFAWGDIFDPAVIAQFEREHGIKVHLNYYSSNEELLVKLKATGGLGYDLIVPSDYAIGHLIKENLLKPLDRTKLDFWQHLNPLLLNHFFDPDNKYSIPFEWELFGLGIDKDFFAGKNFTPSWKMIFDKNIIDYNVTMINDPQEAVLFASFYLYGPLHSITQAQTDAVRNLLLEQRSWVFAYADFRADYFLATRNCPVVIASSSYIWRSKRIFPFIGFAVPEEGTFLTIENLAIPKLTKKDPLVYEFINFLYEPQSVADHYHTYGFFPSTLHALDLLDMDEDAKEFLYIPRDTFQKFYFFQNLMPEETIRNIWVEVKSKTY
ncbi:MAG: extracellular solute-binding protein [Chlamydiota bacterium]